MPKPKSDYAIQAVNNAFRMLEAFYSEPELGVTELSRRLGLHKNNVFRLLATLQESGYIEQNPASECYRLGTRCLELGSAFSRDHTLQKRARAILEDLTASTGETTHIGVLRDFEVVHLDGVVARQLLQCAPRVGQRLPVHCTALGKALLAGGDPKPIEGYGRKLATDAALVPRTPATIVDVQKLLDELGSVAAQGFGVDREECEPGMSCVAAPVFDASGAVVAALSISGPSSRLGSRALHGALGQAVMASAERLSEELGYRS